jgi:uncharacterized membrane protein
LVAGFFFVSGLVGFSRVLVLQILFLCATVTTFCFVFKKKLSLLEFDLETLYLDGVGLIELLWSFSDFFYKFY